MRMGRRHLVWELRLWLVQISFGSGWEEKGLQVPGWERGTSVWNYANRPGLLREGRATPAAQRLRRLHGSRRRDRWIPDPHGGGTTKKPRASQPAPLEVTAGKARVSTWGRRAGRGRILLLSCGHSLRLISSVHQARWGSCWGIR